MTPLNKLNMNTITSNPFNNFVKKNTCRSHAHIHHYLMMKFIDSQTNVMDHNASNDIIHSQLNSKDDDDNDDDDDDDDD